MGRGHTVLSVVASKACESSLPKKSCLVLLAGLHSPQLNQITQVWTQLLTKRVSYLGLFARICGKDEEIFPENLQMIFSCRHVLL